MKRETNESSDLEIVLVKEDMLSLVPRVCNDVSPPA